MHDVAERGDVAQINTLIDGGADIEAKDVYGRTSYVAAVFGQSEAIKVLIDRVANTEASIDAGYTALGMGILGGKAKSLGALLMGGAKVSAKVKNENFLENFFDNVRF